MGRIELWAVGARPWAVMAAGLCFVALDTPAWGAAAKTRTGSSQTSASKREMGDTKAEFKRMEKQTAGLKARIEKLESGIRSLQPKESALETALDEALKRNRELSSQLQGTLKQNQVLIQQNQVLTHQNLLLTQTLSQARRPKRMDVAWAIRRRGSPLYVVRGPFSPTRPMNRPEVLIFMLSGRFGPPWKLDKNEDVNNDGLEDITFLREMP